jgi:hypothetical protein
MTIGTVIPAAMHDRIMRELAQIERKNGVRIVFAIESGSRAWGFPSVDSDFDVRFVYARSEAEYLSVFERPDVIERPIDDALDIGGWDLRKALRLMAGSNAVLTEWLTSPIRYQGDATATDRMLRLAPKAAYLPSYRYHYDRLARRSLSEIRATPEAARLKAYCYALRATLAVLWLRQLESLPPMDMPRLIEGVGPSQAIRDAIAELMVRKAASREGDTIAGISLLDEFMAEALSDPAPRPSVEDRPLDKAPIDRIFREIAFGRLDRA